MVTLSQASRVTLAATLAAPTILNFKSASVVTLKLIPEDIEERNLSYVIVLANASTYTYNFDITVDWPGEKNMLPIVRCLWLAPLESVEWLRLRLTVQLCRRKS